jgi:hypothetical protein
MSDKKEMLIDLVVRHNVSAIVTLSEKLEIETKAVIELINELVSENKLEGSVTEDGTRFFRSNAKVSAAPVIEREEAPPDFLSYDTRPGYYIAIVGAIILITGGVVSVNAVDTTEQDFAAGLFIIGMCILFVGLFLVARRRTPA